MVGLFLNNSVISQFYNKERMNDSFDFNSTQTAGAASEQKAEGIVPILLKQLVDFPLDGNNFQMWGMTFGMVSCVVIVRSIETSSTKITYLLEDHTGRVEAIYWLEEDHQANSPDIMLNNYAKVYGGVRSQGGGQKTLFVFKILPISDPNEVTTHMLEVLNARYKAEQYVMKGASGGAAGGGFNDGFGSKNTSDGSNNMGLDGKHLVVFQAIKNDSSQEGISRKELERKFSHMKSELNNILDFMIGEGHIYSSVDPDHFLSTE